MELPPLELPPFLDYIMEIQPDVKDILTTAENTKLFGLDPETEKYEVMNIAGTLFLCSRKKQPYYVIIILNETGDLHFVGPVSRTIHVELDPPHMIYRDVLKTYKIFFSNLDQMTIIYKHMNCIFELLKASDECEALFAERSSTAENQEPQQSSSTDESDTNESVSASSSQLSDAGTSTSSLTSGSITSEYSTITRQSASGSEEAEILVDPKFQRMVELWHISEGVDPKPDYLSLLRDDAGRHYLASLPKYMPETPRPAPSQSRPKFTQPRESASEESLQTPERVESTTSSATDTSGASSSFEYLPQPRLSASEEKPYVLKPLTKLTPIPIIPTQVYSQSIPRFCHVYDRHATPTHDYSGNTPPAASASSGNIRPILRHPKPIRFEVPTKRVHFAEPLATQKLIPLVGTRPFPRRNSKKTNVSGAKTGTQSPRYDYSDEELKSILENLPYSRSDLLLHLFKAFEYLLEHDREIIAKFNRIYREDFK